MSLIHLNVTGWLIKIIINDNKFTETSAGLVYVVTMTGRVTQYATDDLRINAAKYYDD